jgi:surfeit locus 1 family protein
VREYIVIENILKSESFKRWLPPLAGLIFIVLFSWLGFWQLDRAQQKNDLVALFEEDAPYSRLKNDMPVEIFQRLELLGQFRNDQQVLIDNIVVNGRVGYYVVSAFRHAPDAPLLIVNRGWVGKSQLNVLPDVSVTEEFISVRGRVGRLPRVGIRPGEAFEGSKDWPRVAVYPTLDELATELGSELLPFVLLLSPEADDGFLRRWQPPQSGPMMHYGYAFQWFVMALAIVAVFAWNYRKKRLPEDHDQQRDERT